MTIGPQVPIAPVLTVVNLGQAQSPDGHHLVMLEVSMPSGNTVAFLDAEDAEKLGKQLLVQASMARHGLIIADRIQSNGDMKEET